MRNQVWDFFSNIVSLFDFRVEKMFPEQKKKRWFLRVLAVAFFPVIIPVFVTFSLVDSVIDFFN